MVVHIQGGKGRKDRDVMLSSKLLEELREHWHRLRRRPNVWLFPVVVQFDFPTPCAHVRVVSDCHHDKEAASQTEAETQTHWSPAAARGLQPSRI
jgi:integrase